MIRFVLMTAALAILVSGSPARAELTTLTHIVVDKSDRVLYLMAGDRVARRMFVELGQDPVGDKQVQGDMRTPEGVYYINRRNPNSRYHKSLGISYPNAQDRAEAARLGKPPGGDIFLHGTPNQFTGKNDWTAGCIALSNRNMEYLYRLIPVGMPIRIIP